MGHFSFVHIASTLTSGTDIRYMTIQGEYSIQFIDRIIFIEQAINHDSRLISSRAGNQSFCILLA